MLKMSNVKCRLYCAREGFIVSLCKDFIKTLNQESAGRRRNLADTSVCEEF